MACENLTADIEPQSSALNWADAALLDRMSGMLARLRMLKAQWQRDKWLAHREPMSVAKKRIQHIRGGKGYIVRESV